MTSRHPSPAVTDSRDHRFVVKASLVAFGVWILYSLTNAFLQGGDYVGPDNDDVMRLIEVRDFLAGQDWYDMMQYRLGVEPGIWMHWSRLIDLPIAALVAFFGLFASQTTAEAIALAIWPIALSFPLLYSFSLAGMRLGGRAASGLATALALLFLFSAHRFQPGQIDHHNVQMVLGAIILSALAAPVPSARSHFAAGLAAAAAIAIGAETTPLLAVICAAIALRWALTGDDVASPTKTFGVSLAFGSAFFFFATVPPSRYTVVVCDTISPGFVALSVFGGLALAIAVHFTHGRGLPWRLAALAIIGVGAGGLALTIAPQCLQNPLNELDPILKSLWLDHVREALSMIGQWNYKPEMLGGLYAPGLLAMAACIYFIATNRNRAVFVVFLALVSVSWAIACLQIRGALFANLVSIIPLSMAISLLRQKSREEPGNWKVALGFVAITIASIPSTWFTLGAMLSGSLTKSDREVANLNALQDCRSEETIKALSQLPSGTIATVPDLGVHILRYTDHRVLAAPYHRNQAGMLAAIQAFTTKAEDAEKILRQAGTDYLVSCSYEPASRTYVQYAPEGLLADLDAGNTPDFLIPVDGAWPIGLTVYQLAK